MADISEQQGSDSIAVYFARLKKIWDELEHYQQLSKCHSDHYSNATVVSKERDEEYVSPGA